MHKGDNSPLMVKSPEDQLAGKRFRYAKKAEAEEYIKTHRPNPNRENEASNTELHYQVIAPHCSGRIVVRNGFIVQTSPILEWAFKSDIGGFRSYCKHMRWELREIKSTKALLASRPGSHP